MIYLFLAQLEEEREVTARLSTSLELERWKLENILVTYNVLFLAQLEEEREVTARLSTSLELERRKLENILVTYYILFLAQLEEEREVTARLSTSLELERRKLESLEQKSKVRNIFHVFIIFAESIENYFWIL